VSAAEFVAEFHEVYGCPARTSPMLDVPEAPMRLALIDEEVQELHDAIAAGDLIETADALADIAYVVYGAALTFGIDLDAVLAEVHRSNMSKLGDDGRPIYREDGKILKGPSFSRPDIASVLAGGVA
jgi:predicted HAD superfamily Cof-like phosphohydrolase